MFSAREFVLTSELLHITAKKLTQLDNFCVQNSIFNSQGKSELYQTLAFGTGIISTYYQFLSSCISDSNFY